MRRVGGGLTFQSAKAGAISEEDSRKAQKLTIIPRRWRSKGPFSPDDDPAGSWIWLSQPKVKRCVAKANDPHRAVTLAVTS